MADELDQRLIREITRFLERKGIYGNNMDSLLAAVDVLQREARREGQNQARVQINRFMERKISEAEACRKNREYERIAAAADSMLDYLEEGNAKR